MMLAKLALPLPLLALGLAVGCATKWPSDSGGDTGASETATDGVTGPGGGPGNPGGGGSDDGSSDDGSDDTSASTGDDTGVGDDTGGSTGPGASDDTGEAGPGGPAGPGGGPSGPGPSDDTGVTSGPGGTSGDANAAIAFYINGLIEGDGLSQTFTGAYGVIAYSTDGGYVDFDAVHCLWYAANSSPGTANTCPSCDLSFSVDFDTPVEDGDECDALDEGLGPYGFTGPEFFENSFAFGFVKTGTGFYDGVIYDYGYTAFYFAHPEYTWYTSTDYQTFIYAAYDDPSDEVYYAVNGYYGITWTP